MATDNGFSYDELMAKLFKGFADPLRIAILRLLREGERSVGEIVEALGCSQSRISNHLACLRWCNFVQTRQERSQVFYSLRDQRVKAMVDLADELLRANAERVSSCVRI